MYVGLRADEATRRGIFSTQVDEVFPMRDWGWGIVQVRDYLRAAEVSVPRRTDCARCFFQRLGEWHWLWLNHPTVYEAAAAQERATGHTFRSPSRDTWPASLDGLRARFESGNVPRGGDVGQTNLWGDEYDYGSCRLCRL